MLLFKKKFIEPIRRGEKTQTIRLWKRRCMKAGQRSYIPGIGYVSILEVEPVEINRLTDEDALPDGFANAELLKKELHGLYAEKIEKGFLAYRIRFSVFPPDQQRQMKEEKKQERLKKALEKQRLNDQRQKEFVDATLAKLKRLAEPS